MSHVEISPAVSRFNFSRSQWQAILAAVQDGCAHPHRFSRTLLLACARGYRESMPYYRPPSRRVARFVGAARQLRLARQKLGLADPMIAILEMSVDEFREPLRPGRVPVPVSEKLTVGDLLSKLEEIAISLSLLPPDDPVLAHPREQFYDGVLEIWHQAGGYLRFSRGGPHADKPGRLGGPTVRYLQAVMHPVMGNHAPRTEALPEIIDRSARRLEDLLAWAEEFAPVKEALLMGHDGAAAAVLSKPRKSTREALVRARQLVRGR